MLAASPTTEQRGSARSNARIPARTTA
jgi:hypothetical protein